MKKLKYIILFMLSIGIFNSCLIDDETDLGLNDDGFNTAGFPSSRKTVSAISNGDEYTIDLTVRVVGPTWLDIKNDISLTVAADESSTAIEGTHFRIDNSSVTLLASNNLIGSFQFTMLTDGIVAPLDVSPVLVLKVTGASGDPSTTYSGKTNEVTLNYACFSDLAGTYDVTMVRTHYEGGETTYTWTEYITETGVGEYRTAEVGHWIGGLGVGNPGFTFYDVCNVITIPGQNLVDTYSNWVEGTDFGSVDPVTGDLHMDYSICADYGCYTYVCDYVKQ